MNLIICALLWFTCVAAGLMAGIYFAFSVFGMRALAELGDEAGARAMQSFNRVILKSGFLPLFLLSGISSAALAVIALLRLDQPGAAYMLAGSLTYFIGMSMVTMIGNVPLNNRLDAADAATAEGQAVWRDYLLRWTRLNHVRTVACVVAMVLLVLAIGGELEILSATRHQLLYQRL